MHLLRCAFDRGQVREAFLELDRGSTGTITAADFKKDSGLLF